MTLQQLVQCNSWLSISAILLEIYPDEEKSLEGYETVFEKLLMMASEETDMTIVIKAVKDAFDEEEYVDVSGKYNHPQNEEQSFSQAIEFTSWKKWLGMDICKESLKDFSELEILAHCLYEMTFVGFEEKGIQKELNDLEKTVEDYETMTEEEKQKNRISLEDLLDELNEGDPENEHL
ncbi:hypothetical protein JM83_3707 [Gillisia sp. Hel_I_86]|uniref:DUF6557 family protein n=1 Tax=Gillisia sp. Hel_I_86 TaxID=1249981 RepID=UPI0011998FF8|nr:DUF6557 family protein [Gillisia sp. Hel_I_86]TVZ28573.1 hypothetical protein JM83_3707 [Gillisia sp. Hel_I_86]